MLAIGDVLVHEEVVREPFACNLDVCRGACCWEGDYGAPLMEEEKAQLDAIYPQIRPYLEPSGREVLEKDGRYVYYPEAETWGTPILPDGSCAYLTRDSTGIARCGMELAASSGVTNFPKPISCHLYPIRIQRDVAGFEWLRYERWQICRPACRHGKALGMPIFRFVREAIIRRYGEAFYAELEAWHRDASLAGEAAP